MEVAKVFEGVRKLDDLHSSQPDWKALLTDKNADGGFGRPQTDRESDAIDEKVRALEVLYSQRISILTGGAGTGKIVRDATVYGIRHCRKTRRGI